MGSGSCRSFPGGSCILTFPIDSGFFKTEKPVEKGDLNKIILTRAGKFKGYTNKPEYHGNPINSNGSIVTHYYGYDIINSIKSLSG